MPFDPIEQTEADDKVAVRFDRVTKQYRLYKGDAARFLSVFSRNVACQTVNANDNLSFTIERGEAVAFIGNNGAGKSTALKLITGVTTPTSGTVTVHGKIGALLELTAGFDMNLSGRENLIMRGQIYGMDANDVDAILPEIVEFSDLGAYMDQPMRSYSSGMRARLGFAFITAIRPDILVVDEALSVGDKNFRRKCTERISEIIRTTGATVLFVTHSSTLAQEFCMRGIVLSHGKMMFDGYIHDAVRYYFAEEHE